MAAQFFSSLAEWQRALGAQGCALTIGNFDGIHLGHQAILRRVVERTREMGVLSAVLTFDPHPLKVLRPQAAPPLISTLAQRLARIAELGVQGILVQKFDAPFAQLSPQEFVRQMVAGGLRARVVLVGANFRFGHRQAGDVALLTALAPAHDFSVEIVPPVSVEGKIASSTAVRDAVTAGDLAQAAKLLGRPFELSGTIVRGTGTGAKLLVPTLNLAADQELLPATGVYVTETSFAAGAAGAPRQFPSVTNVGRRPTFDGQQLSVESHLLNFSDPITTGEMRVAFLQRLRAEQKFSGPEALRAQIQRDIARAHAYFAGRQP
jgi:riboflavin kinase/FMN adenylyltransferase